MDLNELRAQINSIDSQILKLLAERREAAERVIEVKQKAKMPLRDARREEDMLAQRIRTGREIGLDAHLVTRVFHEIIDDSVRSQQRILQKDLNRDKTSPKRVAFQGIEGAYSHLASQKFFSPNSDGIEFAGYPTFPEVIDAVEDGTADYGLVPVENTTAGNINEVYDLLSRTRLSVVGEEIFHVQHCLLALGKMPMSKIRRVLSHPQALAQCTRFLSQLENCQQEHYADTAMAVLKVKQDGDTSQAAIASEDAGRRYGLNIIERNIADHPENFTRFVVVSPKPIRVDPRIPSKTSIIMATAHQPGALHKGLEILREHDINMTKLDSRPKPGSPFDYLFYIDFEGNLEEERIERAMKSLRSATSFLKILGSYPIERREKTSPTISSLQVEPKKRGKPSPSKSLAVPEEIDSKDRPYHLACRSAKPEGTVVQVRGLVIGNSDFVVIAGPYCVESAEQIRLCARQVKECGGKLLRGGCFRPHSPGFQGLGFEGLEMLSQAGREYDLPVVTEVVSPEDVPRVSQLADVLQIGARNMQNYSLLNAVGKVNCPVILKREMTSSLEEFLSAAEHILEEGNHQVILCERGIRTFETVTRNTLDLGAIPILKKLTHLPIIVDPSQAAGQRDLVVALARAAHAVGPHGIMLEIHPEPHQAPSDGSQALEFDDFAGLLREIYGK